jgi:hypothetical protein
MKILAIDLGKFKSVACVGNPDTFPDPSPKRLPTLVPLPSSRRGTTPRRWMSAGRFRSSELFE